MTLFHRKLRQQKLTPASGLVSDAWTGLLWSMKGKSCCDYETVKQSKKQKKKEKNKNKGKMPLKAHTVIVVKMKVSDI